VSCAQLLFLFDPGGIKVLQRFSDPVSTMAVNNGNAVIFQLPAHIIYMLQQRPSGDAMQYFRQFGTHTRTFAGCKNNGGDFHTFPVKQKSPVTWRYRAFKKA
jgi:hypothetical protein